MEGSTKPESLPNLKIGIARPEDARGIQEVRVESWRATYPNQAHNITLEDIEARFEGAFHDDIIALESLRLLHPGKKRTLVARDGERIIGFIVVEQQPKVNKLDALHVRPEYQDKGVGTRLWKEIEPRLDPQKKTLVDVAEYNDRAIAFYEKLGFKRLGGVRTHDQAFRMGNGAYIVTVPMILEAKQS